MRRVLSLLLVGFALEGPRVVERRVAPEDELAARIEERAEWGLDDLDVRLDGVPVPQETPRVTLQARRSLSVRDEFEAAEPPASFERAYAEVALESHLGVEVEGAPRTYRAVCSSAIEDREVRFDRKGEESWEATLLGRGPTVGAELDALAPLVDLVELLPRAAVEPGDVWEVEPRALLSVLGAGGNLGFRPVRVDEGSFQDVPTPVVVAGLFCPLSQSLSAGRVDVEGEVTGEVEELEGDVAVLVFELELDADADLDEVYAAFLTEALDADTAEGAGLGLVLSIEGRARLEWDVVRGRPVSLELTAEVECVATVSWTQDTGLFDVDVRCELDLSGTSELEARF